MKSPAGSERQPNVTPLQHLRQFAAFNHHARACADFRQNHAAHAVALGLFIQRHRRGQLCARQARVALGRQIVSFQHPLDARACALRGHAQRLAPLCRCDHADADRFAVQQHAVPHRVFQRMRQRMAKVQLHADTVVVRVFMHIARLNGTAPRDDFIQPGHERRARTQPLDGFKQRLIRDAAVFDDLAQPRADLPRVQRSQRVAVDEHQLRLIKRAEQVLAAWVI